jgi:hypothetical protein
MAKKGWVRLDRLMRSLHLYTGLFLLPWVVVYGASAICLDHNQRFIEHLHVKPPQWEFVRAVDYAPEDTLPSTPKEQAEAILRRLDLKGAHRTLARFELGQLIIFRISGSGNYRIIWEPYRSLLVVEKQPFSMYRLLHFLHFRPRVRPAVLGPRDLGGDRRRRGHLDSDLGRLRGLHLGSQARKTAPGRHLPEELEVSCL